jgi:hypothetical protein
MHSKENFKTYSILQQYCTISLFFFKTTSIEEKGLTADGKIRKNGKQRQHTTYLFYELCHHVTKNYSIISFYI